MFYCFLADGFEEIEALATIDILRRAGIDVITVGVGNDTITGAHLISVRSDITVDDFSVDDEMEGVILPGGMPGVTNLYNDDTVKNAVAYCASNDLYLCAICAAPSIPGQMGLLRGKKATCYPGFETKLEGAQVTGDKVTVDGKIITSKGAGCAMDFGFAIVSEVIDSNTADRVASSMQC